MYYTAVQTCVYIMYRILLVSGQFYVQCSTETEEETEEERQYHVILTHQGCQFPCSMKLLTT